MTIFNRKFEDPNSDSLWLKEPGLGQWQIRTCWVTTIVLAETLLCSAATFWCASDRDEIAELQCHNWSRGCFSLKPWISSQSISREKNWWTETRNKMQYLPTANCQQDLTCRLKEKLGARPHFAPRPCPREPWQLLALQAHECVCLTSHTVPHNESLRFASSAWLMRRI
jgi:hypothetical protein